VYSSSVWRGTASKEKDGTLRPRQNLTDVPAELVYKGSNINLTDGSDKDYPSKAIILSLE